MCSKENYCGAPPKENYREASKENYCGAVPNNSGYGVGIVLASNPPYKPPMKEKSFKEAPPQPANVSKQMLSICIIYLIMWIYALVILIQDWSYIPTWKRVISILLLFVLHHVFFIFNPLVVILLLKY